MYETAPPGHTYFRLMATSTFKLEPCDDFFIFEAFLSRLKAEFVASRFRLNLLSLRSSSTITWLLGLYFLSMRLVFELFSGQLGKLLPAVSSNVSAQDLILFICTRFICSSLLCLWRSCSSMRLKW